MNYFQAEEDRLAAQAEIEMRKREEQLLMYRTPDELALPNAPPPPDNGAAALSVTQASDGTKSIAISPALSMCTCHLHGKPTTKHHITAEQQQQWRARMSSLPTVLTPYGLCTFLLNFYR